MLNKKSIVTIGVLLEHKSRRDSNVLEQIADYAHSENHHPQIRQS